MQDHTRCHRMSLSERARRLRRSQLDPGPRASGCDAPAAGPGPGTLVPAPGDGALSTRFSEALSLPPSVPFSSQKQGAEQPSAGQFQTEVEKCPQTQSAGRPVPIGCVTAKKDTDTLREGWLQIKERKRVGPLNAAGPFATKHVIGTLGKLRISPVD